jgi:hypothetical protein
MWRRLKKVAAVFVVVFSLAFAAAQFVRPERSNPRIDPARTLQAQAGTSAALIAVIDRACGDCHSNGTMWARYTRIAPLSWVITRGVTEGRKAVNFSEWGAYSVEARRALLVASCRDASIGRMPMSAYLLVRPEARLSVRDVETICAASRQVDANTANTVVPQSRGAR